MPPLSRRLAFAWCIRAAFERRAAAYLTAYGLTIPVAFLIGSGRRPG